MKLKRNWTTKDSNLCYKARTVFVLKNNSIYQIPRNGDNVISVKPETFQRILTKILENN